MSSVSSRVAKNTGYLYARSMVSLVAMLLVTRIVFQQLGVIDYGIYNVVSGAVALLIFLKNTLAIAMQRYLNHYQGVEDLESQRKVFNVGIIYHWSLALFLILALVVLGNFMFNGILSIPEDRVCAAKISYLCLIVNTCFTVVSAPYDAAITAHENMLYFSIVGMLESMMKLTVAVCLLYVSGDKLIIYALLMMFIPVVTTALMCGYCTKKYEECAIRPKRYYDKQIAQEMRLFIGWSMIGASTNVVSNHGSNIALNHFFGAAINAVAGIANQIQGALNVMFTGLMKSLTPVIFKSEGAGNEKDMINFSYLGCKYSSLLFSLMAVPVFIQTPYLLDMWLGQVPEWAVLFVRLQLLRALLEQLGASLITPLNATNHIKEINLISIIVNLVPIIVLVVLYSLGAQPYWHYFIMISMMTIGQNLTMLILCKKFCALQYGVYFKLVIYPCLIIVAVSLLFGSVPILWVSNKFLQFATCFLMAVVSFLITYWMLMQPKEKVMIKKVLYKIRRKQ